MDPMPFHSRYNANAISIWRFGVAAVSIGLTPAEPAHLFADPYLVTIICFLVHICAKQSNLKQHLSMDLGLADAMKIGLATS